MRRVHGDVERGLSDMLRGIRHRVSSIFPSDAAMVHGCMIPFMALPGVRRLRQRRHTPGTMGDGDRVGPHRICLFRLTGTVRGPRPSALGENPRAHIEVRRRVAAALMTPHARVLSAVTGIAR